MVQEDEGQRAHGTCDNRGAGQMALPFCVLVPNWRKKTPKMCSPGICAWQRNEERLRQKCSSGGRGGVVGDLPHVSLTSTLSLGAQAVDASACGTKENSKSRGKNRFLEGLLKEDRDMGDAGG
jgi:hypothetical protein